MVLKLYENSKKIAQKFNEKIKEFFLKPENCLKRQLKNGINF